MKVGTSEVKTESMDSKDEEMQDREQKIRKTDEDSKKNTPFSMMIQNEIEKKKKELAELEQKSNEAKSDETMEDLATGSGQVEDKSVSMGVEEKMEVEPQEPSNEHIEVDEDPGEIHIVSMTPLLIDLKVNCVDYSKSDSKLNQLMENHHY